MGAQILWQRLDLPGHEFSSLNPRDGGWQLAGSVLVAQDGVPCVLNYSIECDAEWQTQSVAIDGFAGERPVSLELTRSPGSVWHYNGVHVSEVDGCIDIDLGFSPSTNLLAMRRLVLAIGNRADVRAAWVRFPEFSLELLEQAYTRLGEDRYLYQSAGGAFRKELLVSPDGFVLEYPGLWRTEAVNQHRPHEQHNQSRSRK